ncbi:MAG: aldo/keto reductase [Acetobacter sp.]|nr:aldo/keto reductase [Acetobacter sp.]
MTDTLEMGRRSFLKTAAVMTALAVMPPLTKKSYAQNINKANDNPFLKDKRILGKEQAAMQVSALGFGCMGLNYHRSEHPDKKQAIYLLHQAINHGITLFDTAETYGPFINEELVGEGLKGYGDKIQITTKFGFSYNGNKVTGLDSSPKRIREMVEQSLKRLKRDYIDMLYQHRFDPKTPIEEVAETIKDLIKEGKVKHWGMCEVSAATIRKAHKALPLTALQSEYHLMWREPENDILQTLKELGIGFVPYSPLNRGFLSGMLNEYTKFDANNDNRATFPRFTPQAMRHNMQIIEVLNQFGRTRGLTPAQIALAWLMNKADWIVPIPGTTKLAHLEENIRAVDVKIPEKDWKNLENELSAIEIMGSRYPADQQAQVGK